MTVALNISFDDLQIRSAADGLIALDRKLDEELLTPIGAHLEATTMERFETNLAPDGTPWLPSLRAKLTGTRTLVEEGNLRSHIYHVVSANAVEVGSPDVYSAVHQFGATISAKTSGGLSFRLADGAHRVVQSVEIPARPFLGLSTDDTGMIVRLSEDALARAITTGAA